MKTAIIYYSYNGNTALVADLMKSELNADTFEIKVKDEKKKSGFIAILSGGFQVFKNKKPELLPLSVDIKAYDLIILGTPVWAGSPAPAIVSYLHNNRINGKKIALYCCHGGGPGKVFEKIKERLFGNNFCGEIDFRDALKQNPADLKKKIGEWIKAFT